MPKIVLVEDNAITGRKLAARLSQLGKITWVRDLSHAEPLLEAAWDGWVIDRGLPDGDGLAFAERVRKAQPRVPIVIHTGRDPAEILSRTTRRGIVVSAKPSHELLLFEARRWADAVRRRESARERLAELKKRAGLTDLQEQVVVLALAGMSRAQAAREMGISPLTHRTHVTRTLRRTGHGRLAQLVAELAGEPWDGRAHRRARVPAREITEKASAETDDAQDDTAPGSQRRR